MKVKSNSTFIVFYFISHQLSFLKLWKAQLSQILTSNYQTFTPKIISLKKIRVKDITWLEVDPLHRGMNNNSNQTHPIPCYEALTMPCYEAQPKICNKAQIKSCTLILGCHPDQGDVTLTRDTLHCNYILNSWHWSSDK